MPTSRRGADSEGGVLRLAGDANVLLSAVVRGRARLVLEHPGLEVFTTASTLAEVQEYLERLATKRRLAADVVLLAAATLPVTIVDREDYISKLPEASRRISQRDPDDVELLALALALDLTVWSNDNDFEGTGVRWLTTAQLLRRIE